MPEALLLSSARVDTTEPMLADGAVAPLSMNADGRLRVSSKQGAFALITGNLTAIGNTVVVDVSEASNVMCHVKNTGTVTHSAGQYVFEGSLDSTDGVNGTWFGLQAVRSNVNTVEASTGTISMVAGAGLAYSWELSVNAVKWMRIRCTTAATVNSIATWSVQRGSYATEPIPAIQTHAITGSVTATPVAGSAFTQVSIAGTNALVIKSSAGTLGEMSVYNSTAATIYLRLYNKATAPVVGTDTPIMVIPIPAGTLYDQSYGSLGKRFTLGIGMALTAGPTNLDATAVAAGVITSGTFI